MTTWGALAVVLSLIHVPAPQSPALKAETAADMKELSSYTLTLETLNKVDRAMRGMMVEAKKDPRYQELAKIEADLEALEKKGQESELTEADDKRIETLEARREAIKSDYSLNMGDAATISAMAAKVEKFPPMMAALRSAGLTAREFSKFTMAMLQAGIAAGMQKAGLLKETPAGTNPANVKWILQHEAELTKLQQAWAELGK